MCTLAVISSSWITAGILSERAMMLVWDVQPPRSTANPFRCLRFQSLNMEKAISSLTRMMSS